MNAPVNEPEVRRPDANPRKSAGAAHPTKRRARDQFDSWAESYDRSIVQRLLFEPSYRMFMAELYAWRKDVPDGFDLLDIGAGTGTWLARAAGSGLPCGRLVGLDFSETMCRVAADKSRERTERHGRCFVNGDSEHLPFADASFDAVTCSHSFHHYPHQSEVVREMRRVLRPGGRLMIIDGFRDNVIGWVLYDVFITRGESKHDARVHHVPWSAMRRHFLDAGFRHVRQAKRNIWAPLLLTVGEA